MKLRLRLAVAALAVTLPVGLLLLGYDQKAQHTVAEQRLAGLLQAHVAGDRTRCEADPASFGGRTERPPRPPPDSQRRKPPMVPVVFAYDDALHARNPNAPQLSASLRESIRERDMAVAPFRLGSSDVEVLVATPWRTGPCAYFYARGSTFSGWGIFPESNLWLLPPLAVFAAVLLALGPVIRRIRHLGAEVRRSAESAYATNVVEEGRDEIAELARAFNAAGSEVRARLAEKDLRERALRDFVANTTHDVMIPLTVLQGHLTTLRDVSARGEAIDPRVVTSAMSEAHYMAALVHNLDAAARLDAMSAPAADAVDLGALVQRIMSRHRPIARELGIAIESATPEEPLHVSGDVTLLEQAVSNVTYNAIRYNRQGGHVAVILERKPDDRFSLRVIDDGPGIPEADRARLAERGARGNDARTRAPAGQGLGLPIALRAAVLHDFTLNFDASEYGGLEVRLEGPCRPDGW